MELRGCSEENHRPLRIQPRVPERLRNAHLATGNPRAGGVRQAGMAHSTAMTTPMRRSGGLAALLIALLVAACGSSSPTPAPSASAAAPPDGLARAQRERRAARRLRRRRRPPRPAIPTRPWRPASPARPPTTRDAALYEEIEQQVIGLRGITPTTTVERGVFDKASLCAYIASSFRKDNPEELDPGDGGPVQGPAAHAPGRVARGPVHRAAHEPGRGALQRRHEEDVRRRHRVGRDRPDRADHVRPRVHPRAPGPAVHAERPRRRGQGPGRPDDRADDARRG